MKIKGIIFDLIDTLAYINAPLYREKRMETAGYAHVELSVFESIWRKYQNERISGEIPDLKVMMEKVLDDLGSSGADAETMAKMEIAGLKDSLISYPGVEKMLESLSGKGYQLAIISNSGENVEKAASDIPWIKFFNPVVFSYKARITKPDRAIFTKTAQMMGLSPGECIFIGDGDNRELDGAQDAGMTAIRVIQPHQNPTGEMSEKYHYVIDSIGMLPEALRELENPPESSVENPKLLKLWKMLEEKDPFTSRHSRRVAALLEKFALGQGQSKEEARYFKVAGLLHDLGKLDIPDSIFGKLQDGSRINTEEINLMKTHASIPAFLQGIDLPPLLEDALKFHHERFDGSGYPRGLKGEEIPVSVRMLSVADFYDTIVVQRQWKTPGLQNPLNKKDAFRLLVEESHTRLDPELVSRFVSIMSAE